MSGRRFSARTVRIAVRGGVTDVALVLLWRFVWRHSWTASLVAGAVTLVLTIAATATAWWLDHHPDAEERMRVRQLSATERRAREMEAAEASRRATGPR